MSDLSPIVPPLSPVNPNVVNVDVKSAWASKINWVQAVSVLSTVIALIFGQQYEIPADIQVQIVTGINVMFAVVTWILRTYFTTKVTQQSVKRALG